MSIGNLTHLNRCIHWRLLSTTKLVTSSQYKTAPTSLNKRYLSRKIRTTNSEEEIDNTEPIKFSTSLAARWKAEDTRTGGADDSPPSQTYIVTFSLSVFLIYFLVLREENDIDIKLRGGDLFDNMTNLEEIQLKLVVEDDENNNRTSDPAVLRRLEELQNMRSQIAI